MCDNAADYRSLPIIIGANQSARAIMQFQCRISQYIGHPKSSELRANGANNDRLWFGSLDDETSNHHIVACLDKAASADVAEHGVSMAEGVGVGMGVGLGVGDALTTMTVPTMPQHPPCGVQ